MKLSDYVMSFIHERGIRHVFGYQGGAVTHLVDSLHKIDGLSYVQNYHEQASAFCADAYSRINRNFGVALATSGPGATNLITGIANAYFDSIPCLFLTGQVSTHAIKSKSEIRQQSFQETDIVSIVSPITKFAKTIVDPQTIRYYLEKAVFTATTERPGSVLLDLPHNVQATDINPESLDSFFDSKEYKACDRNQNSRIPDVLREIAGLLSGAKRPLVLAGGGVAALKDREIFKQMVRAFDLPVVCSLMGLGAIDHSERHYFGFIGSYGNRHSNMAIAKSDLLLVLGSRLDERQTGPRRDLFARNARVIHVDIDPDLLDHHVDTDICVCADLQSFLSDLLGLAPAEPPDNGNWINQVHLVAKELATESAHDQDYIDPNHFIRYLSTKLSKDAVVCSDVGQNMMWVAQSLDMTVDMRLLNSGGHGAMGYSLPAGIGAYCADQNRQVVCIAGDGGIQMNIQELQTIAREGLPIKIIVMNNQSLGMVRGFHEKYFDNKCYGTALGYSNPDFSKVACAFGLEYTKIESKDNFNLLDDGLKGASPHLIEVILSPESQTIPEPAPGPRGIEDQFPLIDREKLARLLSD